jgi:copper homeostasis protein
VAVLIEAALESATEIGAADPATYDRLEACDFSVEGGRTPLELTLRDMLAAARHPVQVLIRPRGGAFIYGDAELTLMERQIDLARTLGASGVVIGALLPSRKVDRVATARLTGAARPMSVTFHRAIDLTPEPLEALEALLMLGVNRALTSGGAATALEGAPMIRKIVERAGNDLVVMAGGGVRARNVKELVDRSGVREVHARDVRGMREALSKVLGF